MNGEGRWDPERLGRLTLPQLLCLFEKEPPGEAGAMRTREEFREALERRTREDREWYSLE